MARLVDDTPIIERPAHMTPGELEDAVRSVEPAALLVPARILRRVIKQDAEVSGLGLRVPHRKSYTITRKRLLEIVDLADLDLVTPVEMSEEVLLIARPSAEVLADMTTAEALVKYWRLLFHCRVHQALGQSIQQGQLSDAVIRTRVRQLGATEFEEIKGALRQEEFLLPPRSDTTVYVEFSAVYLELRCFAPSLLRCYFPSLDLATVDEILKQDVDVDVLLSSTRLAGTSESATASEAARQQEDARERQSLDNDFATPRKLSDRIRAALAATAEGVLTLLTAGKSNKKLASKLMAKADRASAVGNVVRAIILRTRAAQITDSPVADEARDQAHVELTRLAQRLQDAVGFSDGERDEWIKSLFPLLEQSAKGFWTAEARMLYDLQKVCIDHERGIYTLDLYSWITSLGRKPLRRALPGQRDVMISKHLRGAARRLSSAKLSHRARNRLGALVQSAVHRAEASLRGRFKPALDRALDDVRLLPQNPPERVARKKLVDELLDRIVDRGYLSMSDLRDALSRNNLKLPDLASAEQFINGDQLLMADQQLGQSLDGVYHPGEVYLRWPQRLSSLAFGTPFGRILTRYLVLPFGGAYLMLEGAQYLVDEPLALLAGDGPARKVHFIHFWSVLALGVLILGLMNHRQFRTFCVAFLAQTRKLLRQVFIDLPSWLSQLPLVQAVVRSRSFRLFKQLIFKPLVISAAVSPLLAWQFQFKHTWPSLTLVFLVVNFAINSRIGRNMDEMVTDWVVNTWHRLRIHVFATLFRVIMDTFNRILEGIERFLYTVDEWLRFRAGERPGVAALKAVLGFVWFFVNYVIRFLVTLMVEPQVNPIKHFPVVTVSHKILLPLMLALHKALEGAIGSAWAWVIAGFIQFLVPGMCGFLVWELKENWRLYAANRPPNLRPVSIGSHGETMLQFLRPGFRSGTVPKLYAKLRRASRRAYWTHHWRATAKFLDQLHHVSESIRRFTNRELLELLHESRSWQDRSITTGEVHLGANRILIELYCPTLSEDSLWLAFEDQSGWLVASIYKRGWSDALGNPRRQALATALAGFFKLAGVELSRDQIESQLEPGSPGYEVTDDALIVWSARREKPLAVPLQEWMVADTRQHFDSFAIKSTAADRRRWVFAATPIAWRRWVVTWELDQLGGSTKHQVIESLNLLPHEQSAATIG